MKIGLVVKNDSNARRKADEFESWLKARCTEVIRRESLPFKHERGKPPSAPADLFCIFVLGGDGTFLSAVRWIGNHSIPILGVKFGEVGFLAEITEERLFEAAQAILDRDFTTTARMRLQVDLFQNETLVYQETVLNDAVVTKVALARLANVETFIDAHYLTTYRADGLIVATPTGSTAYSLAAGGPILHPSVDGIIMTPICPFTLTNRPLIVPDTVSIELRLTRESSNMMLSCDGQEGRKIDHLNRIVVHKAPTPVHLITLAGHDYFEVLKAKLRWSGGRA
jgi:NAD+ kinase